MGKTNENLLPSCPAAMLLEGKVFKVTASEFELNEWASRLI